MASTTMTATTNRRRQPKVTAVKHRADTPTQVFGHWKPRVKPNGLTSVDLLCGGGGSSQGLHNAGVTGKLAINHWLVAVMSHQANFPDMAHACADVTTVHIRSMPTANILWISPICTEASPAGGNKKQWRRPDDAEVGKPSMRDDEDYVPEEGLEKTRATFWEAIKYAEYHQPEAIIVENVPDVVTDWQLFDYWLMGMTLLGYRWQLVNINSAHIGGDGIDYAPQWRDRIYVVFIRKDIKNDPDVVPRPLSWCFSCRQSVEGIQTWCPSWRDRKIKVGRYRRRADTSYGQYWYGCSRGCLNKKGEPARVEPYILPAAAALDWNDKGKPIAESNFRKPNSLRRIARGQDMFWPQPTTMTLAGNTFERNNYLRAWPAGGSPLATQQCTLTEGLTLPPFVFNANNSGDDRFQIPGQEPLTTQATKAGVGVCMPFSFIPGGRREGAEMSAAEPMRTQLTNGKGSEGLVMPPENDPFWMVLRRNSTASGMGEPVPTLTSGGRHLALVVPYNKGGQAYAADEQPFGTATTKDRNAVATPGDDDTFSVRDEDGGLITVRNCNIRMINWKEAARSQTLEVDRGYVLLGTEHENTAMAGNAVSSNVAQFLGERVSALLMG